jgi:hypothetical protein
MRIGESVVFVDSHRQEHAALLTNVFDNGGDVEAYPNPAVNLVYVSSDEAEHDGYGRQIKRMSSCSHVSNNSAKANCWKRVGE